MATNPILVPLDGSEPAECAVRYAEVMASAYGAPLLLLAVMEEPAEAEAVEEQDEALGYAGRVRRPGMCNYLAYVAGEVAARGYATETMVEDGPPTEQILAVARKRDARLIVMATRGRGGLERWMLGSVADEVMRLSDRPVLLVPPAQGESVALPRRLRLRHITVPLDGSPLAEQAVGPAAELAVKTGADLTLVRVEPWLTTWAPSFEYVPNLADADRAVSAAAAEYLEAVRERIQEPVTVVCEVLRGSATDALVQFARGVDTDLLVMTTHGRGGLKRLVLGSVADCMVRSGLPALLIRPGARAETGLGARERMTVHNGC